MSNDLFRTALPLSSWSLLFAWANKALASSCNTPAFLLASADSSVFLAMSSSTVLYLPLSSLLRTCSECKHKMELVQSQYSGRWHLLPLSFTNPAARRVYAGSSVNKSRNGVRVFPTPCPRRRAMVKTHQLLFCRSVAVLQLQYWHLAEIYGIWLQGSVTNGSHGP